MMNLMIELTNRCTLRCPTCFSHQDSRVKADMSLREFKGIIDENISLIGSVSLYNYGEPFLNARLPEMILYAKKKGVSYIKVATNGMHLTGPKIKKILDSKLDYISISLDGATKSTYEVFRVGGQFKRIVSNMHDLVRARNALRSDLKIEIQFIIMRHNEHEIRAIEKLARSLKVDFLRLKTVLVKKDEWKYFLPASSRYSRYSRMNNKRQCFKPLKEVTVNCDGSVIPCCYIVGEDIKEFCIGNIFDHSLKDILSSKKYQEFVKICTTKKSDLSSCAGCNEGDQPLDYKIIEMTGCK
ncbi:MAG: radical SAM protein [Candidatus Omnitrophica bacterium]|nr:radical SAM protein [Candidatus Omnitrophota bacterium]